MAQKKIISKILPYLQGIFAGIISALIIIYLLNVSGLLVISAGNSLCLINIIHWCYGNLGLSIIPFTAALWLYFVCLRKLSILLNIDNPDAVVIVSTEEKVDLLVNIFFGIGVIWTAIGMRNALLASLGNMDAETAAQKGAFYILTKLVEGGILLALSTTIFGGIGGYFMRMTKSWVVGARLTSFFEQSYKKEQTDVLDRLDHIVNLLEKNH